MYVSAFVREFGVFKKVLGLQYLVSSYLEFMVYVLPIGIKTTVVVAGIKNLNIYLYVNLRYTRHDFDHM